MEHPVVVELLKFLLANLPGWATPAIFAFLAWRLTSKNGKNPLYKIESSTEEAARGITYLVSREQKRERIEEIAEATEHERLRAHQAE